MIGQYIVEFEDGTKISYSLPYLWVRGILWGERVMDYCGEMPFEDKKNGFKYNFD